MELERQQLILTKMEVNNMTLTIIGWYVVLITMFLSLYTASKNRSVAGNIVGFILFFMPTLVYVLATLLGGR